MEFNLSRETARRYGLGTLAAVTAMLAPVAISGCADESLNGDQAVEVQHFDPSETGGLAEQVEVDCAVEALSDDPYGC